MACERWSRGVCVEGSLRMYVMVAMEDTNVDVENELGTRLNHAGQINAAKRDPPDCKRI